jgi:hypothetical protein
LNKRISKGAEMQSQKLFTATVRSLIFLTILLALSLPCVRGRAGVGVAAAPLAALSGTKSVCPSGGDYATLTAAIADIKSEGLDGPLVLELCSTYTSGSETFPLEFTAFTGSSATNTVTVRPAADATGLTITSSAAQTIDLDGATYVIFDGRPGGVGSAQELTIENTSTSGNAVRFVNSASHNTLQYVTLKGVNTSSGVVHFAGAGAGSGNDDNLIDHCDLRDGATTPRFLVHSFGTSGQENSGNTLSNNRFRNFFRASAGSFGVYIAGGNTAWTISGNSFYQEGTRTSSAGAAHYAIDIQDGDGYVITSNVIGGSQEDGGGAAWTYDGSQATSFQGIYLSVGATTPSSVQGNTIANFEVSSSSTAPWRGIYVESGAVNIGTVTGNTIGSGTGTGSVQVTTSGSGAYSYGIRSSSTSGVTVTNNVIGSITVSGTTTSVSHSFYGIYVTAGANSIISNTIGSATTADSIQAATASTSGTPQHVFGIYLYNATSATISDNTIANLTNAYAGSGAGQIVGIRTSADLNTITGNTVRNLTTASANTRSDESGAVIGISLEGTTAGQTVARNVVHSLADTAASGAIQATGIYYAGPTSGDNVVARNFVHSLSLATSGAGEIRGIHADAGLTTYQNNLVRLGVDASGAAITSDYAITGIEENVANNFYFNTVYVGGGPVASGSNDTFAFRSTVFSGVRANENNLFVNARANDGGTGAHVAARYDYRTSLTSDYNVYLASGAGGVPLQTYSTDYTLNTWQSASGQDSHSIAPASLAQVNLANPTGDAASLDLHVQSPSVIEGAGVDIPSVTDDYAGQTRSALTPVDIGAYAGDYTAVGVPAFSYTPLANTLSIANPTLSPVTVTAASGVNVTSGTRPRLYYKRSTDADTFNDNPSATDGWKWVEAEGTGGSPFSFTLDYARLNGGVADSGGDVTIQYFVVAQSLAATPVVGLSGGVFVSQPASVALTSAAFPLGGRGERDAGGLFAAINGGGLVGDLTAEIRGDLTETGANGLNQ